MPIRVKGCAQHSWPKPLKPSARGPAHDKKAFYEVNLSSGSCQGGSGGEPQSFLPRERPLINRGRLGALRPLAAGVCVPSVEH